MPCVKTSLERTSAYHHNYKDTLCTQTQKWGIMQHGTPFLANMRGKGCPCENVGWVAILGTRHKSCNHIVLTIVLQKQHPSVSWLATILTFTVANYAKVAMEHVPLMSLFSTFAC